MAKKKSKSKKGSGFQGSVGWAIFWVIFFWPAAIVYILLKWEK